MAIKPLKPQETVFAKVYAETGSAAYAGHKAGVAHPETNGFKVLARPAVQETIRHIQERRIKNDLMPKSLDLLEKAIVDPKNEFKIADRIRAAAEVRQWYTLVTGSNDPGKDPADMSPDELQGRIAELRARQAQLAEGAKTIEGEAIEVAAKEAVIEPETSVFD